MEQLISVESAGKSSSGLVYDGPCVFMGMLLGTDGVNDPTVTLYDNTAGSGDKILPTTVYDSGALGLNGVSGAKRYCKNGIYVAITCAGTVEVSIQYTPWYRWNPPYTG